MPRIKIKQLDERVSTSGVSLGGGPERRKMHPGEVVDIPDEFEAGKYDRGMGLFDLIWATGKVELTHDPVTRPIDFDNEREAKLTSPTFVSRGPDDDHAIAEAKRMVAERLAAAERPSETAPAQAPPAPNTSKNRRARKRIEARKRHATQEATA